MYSVMGYVLINCIIYTETDGNCLAQNIDSVHSSSQHTSTDDSRGCTSQAGDWWRIVCRAKEATGLPKTGKVYKHTYM